tara:strand:+ start:237 stop:1202 length:966 start_codon:yes stop_codon:yes gene_type:complete
MNFKSLFKIFFPIILGIFFIYLSIDITTKEERRLIFQSIKNADLKFVFVGLIFAFLSHFSRAYRWRFLLSPMGYKPKLINCFLSVLAAYLANMGVPRSGELVRASLISNYEQIPFEKGFGSIVIERVVDLIMLSIIILIAIIIEKESIWNFIVQNNINFLELFVLGTLLVFCIYLIFISLKKSENKLLLKFKLLIDGFWEGVISIKKMEKKNYFLLHTLFIWIMYLAMFYVIKWSIPGTFNLTFNMIIPVFVVGGLSIATTNGGIGVFPLSIALVLNSYGISKDVGLSFGWIMWSSQTIFIILLGILSFIALPLINRKHYI